MNNEIHAALKVQLDALETMMPTAWQHGLPAGWQALEAWLSETQALLNQQGIQGFDQTGEPLNIDHRYFHNLYYVIQKKKTFLETQLQTYTD
ncbi:MAG: hypothetical protein KTR14_04255 [Vampirovibrio sp.]|nr:hypothetical protein [Vampirovibrio sp.]